MFPRSASSLENPQENCLKSYWPALMQFLMKMPPIIRLTGAGCYQCPWCWVQWSMTSPESPDGHQHCWPQRGDTPDWVLMSRNCNIATWVSKILAKDFPGLIIWNCLCSNDDTVKCQWRAWLPSRHSVSAPCLIHYSRGRIPVPRSQMFIKIAAPFG